MESWMSKGDQSMKLEPDTPLVGNHEYHNPGLRKLDMWVDPTQRHQEMTGFGAALTNSAANVLYYSRNKDFLINKLFGTSGINLNVVRLTMGGSDFMAIPPYTYQDLPDGQTDFDMHRFSIDKDREFVIPILKDILRTNPQVKIFATPWSAPAWMKDNKSLNNGTLRHEGQFQEAYAQYFVRFIQAYAAEGITIDYITIQNEPLHFTDEYPTMKMLDWEQRDFIKNYLGPAFYKYWINTKIVIYDHNWDNVEYAKNILWDQDARQYIDGTAFHCYAGDFTAPSDVHWNHPDKNIYFTECTGGSWDQNFMTVLPWNMKHVIIGQPANFAKTVLLWNLALNEHHGPKVDVGGCSNCRGVVTVRGDGAYSLEFEYYLLGHLSKFVQPGAYRIGSGLSDETNLSCVSFQNPDGTIVMVVANTDEHTYHGFIVHLGGMYYTHENLPNNSAVTLVLRP